MPFVAELRVAWWVLFVAQPRGSSAWYGSLARDQLQLQLKVLPIHNSSKHKTLRRQFMAGADNTHQRLRLFSPAPEPLSTSNDAQRTGMFLLNLWRVAVLPGARKQLVVGAPAIGPDR